MHNSFTKLFKIILFGAIVFNCTIGFGQENIYFENHPVWKETISCAIPYPCVETNHMNYYTEGDTVISGINYIKLYEQGVTSRMFFENNPPDFCTGSEIYLHVLKGYLRSANRQIFYIPADAFDEQLLYDFNLSIGDTLPNTLITNPWGTTIVTAIDSIEISEGYFKRFHLDGLEAPAPFLIEGIGSNKGLFAPMPQTLECGFNLDCYSQNGTVYFGGGDGGTCLISVGVDEAKDKPKLSLYPNPTSNYSTLQLHGVSGQVDIFIHDFSGRQVRQYSIAANKAFSFYSGELPQGIYLLSINQSGRLLGSEKLIITP